MGRHSLSEIEQIDAVLAELCARIEREEPVSVEAILQRNAHLRPQLDVAIKPFVDLISIQPWAFQRDEVVLNRYRIERPVGSGGMAQVFMARDMLIDSIVAIKVLNDDLSSELLLKELNVALRIGDDNVCRYHTVHECDDSLLLIMEYLPHDLRAYIGERFGSSLPYDVAISASHQICAGLSAVHNNGVVICDLKPENILVREVAEEGELLIKLSDFGLAQMVHQKMSSRGGTLRYMAPELWSVECSDPKMDIYSLGAVLFELFTGDHPDSSEDHDQWETRLLRELPYEMRFCQTIIRCLDRHPERRPNLAEVKRCLPQLRPSRATTGRTPVSPRISTTLGVSEINQRHAVGMFVMTVAAVILAFFSSSNDRAVEQAYLPSAPTELASLARKHLQARGVEPQPHFALGFLMNDDSYRKASKFPSDSLVFWYRQHSAPLLPSSRRIDRNNSAPRTTMYDPPRDHPDMADVVMTTSGSLVSVSNGTSPNGGVSKPKVTEKRQSSQRIDDALFAAFIFLAIAGSFLFGNRRHITPDFFVVALRVAVLTFLIHTAASLAATTHAFGWQLWSYEVDVLKTCVANGLLWAGLMWLFYIAVEPTMRSTWPTLTTSWNRLGFLRWHDPQVGWDVLVGCLVAVASVPLLGSIHLLMRRLFNVHDRLGYSVAPPDSFTFLVGAREQIAFFLEAIVNGVYHGLVLMLLPLFFARILRYIGFERAVEVIRQRCVSIRDDRSTYALTKIVSEAIVRSLSWIDRLIVAIPTIIIAAQFFNSYYGDSSWLPYMYVWATLFVSVGLRWGLLALSTTLALIHIMVYTPMTIKLDAWYVWPQAVLGTLVILTTSFTGLYITVLRPRAPFVERRVRQWLRSPNTANE